MVGFAELRNWVAYRELRLAALTEAPRAVGTTLAREEALTPVDWRARLRRGGIFAACAASGLVGTAAGIPADAASHCELVGMWVHPKWRGQGVGDLLVRGVIDWATAGPYQALDLWVSVGNDPAVALYARHGFVATGSTRPIHKEDPARLALGMVRAL